MKTLSATLSRVGRTLRGGDYTGPGAHVPLLSLFPRQVAGSGRGSPSASGTPTSGS